jgi:hypothetical protein
MSKTTKREQPVQNVEMDSDKEDDPNQKFDFNTSRAELEI